MRVFIERNEVDFTPDAAEQVCKDPCVAGCIIYISHQNIFKGDFELLDFDFLKKYNFDHTTAGQF